MKSLLSLPFRLRPEEAAAVLFLAPTTYLTIVAANYANEVGLLGARYPGGVVRISVAAIVVALLGLARTLWPQSRAVRLVREVVPFGVCILIYTNLHDTIGFVNRHDVHDALAAADKWLFGVVPCVWTERFVSRPLTEAMSFLYGNFFWIAPSTSTLLVFKRRYAEARATVLGIIVCFYLGYLLYVAFPAAPPRLVLAHEFTKTLSGYPHFFAQASKDAFALLPSDSRAAFPSLHSAVSLLALLYAWRYVRAWFWTLLPFVIGLWASTVYLRHHFVVDIFAGWALAPIAMALAPRLDAWWAARQRALGYRPALGVGVAAPSTDTASERAA
jgi:membrane-associated phospholipid phosphatase